MKKFEISLKNPRSGQQIPVLIPVILYRVQRVLYVQLGERKSKVLINEIFQHVDHQLCNPEQFRRVLFDKNLFLIRKSLEFFT